ncbi:hypothetical protein AB9K26_10195 [Psychroserpens sp. XS_ASV72]|uniref:hypothetical protein n=1 Tax=Psychroserpens sp. XS_ASV72 TaxID=3241293 RepID=UPI0035196501
MSTFSLINAQTITKKQMPMTIDNPASTLDSFSNLNLTYKVIIAYIQMSISDAKGLMRNFIS